MAKKKSIPDIIQYVRSHPPKVIDYSFQKNISFSQLSLYNQCPYKWKLQYKDKRKVFTSSISTVFGTSMHLVIQHYLTVLFDESGAAADRIDLEDMFQESLQREYLEQYKVNNNQHFSSSEEMSEFYEDGLQILDFLKKNRSKYFSNRGWYIVGVEIPVILPPLKDYPYILYLGYLDLVLYHEPTNTIKIYDLKSSKKSWGDYQKKDPNKTNQLLLYKQYFSELYKFPIENIEVEFFILKRKLYEESEFVQHRIQTFTPANGAGKIRKANESVYNFITECFNQDNTIKERDYPKNPSKLCDWCPFQKECNN